MIPRIYNFTDYRSYLSSVVAYLKTEKISMRSLAREIGVSNAYISMVLSAKRNLDPKFLERFSDYLKLNNSERSYFKSLIIICDDVDSRKRSEAYQKLAKFRSYRTNKTDDVITHKYLNNWYYVAIRELSFLADFKDDPEWIKCRLRPSLSITKIKDALNFLKKNNLLCNTKDKHLNCSDGVYKLSLTHFHQDMLKVMGDSIENVDRSKRMLLGFTKSLSRSDFVKATEILKNALNQLEALEQSTEHSDEELFHFYLMGIPLTQKDNK